MSRVFVTGDFHGGIDCWKLRKKYFNTQSELSKEDIVIILGDAGFVWNGKGDDAYWQEWISNKPFTTFCVVGNHENYDLIKNYPIVDFCGGKARKITDSLFYEIRGEVYTFGGKTFLSCGGAESTDKGIRKEGVSWWKDESISFEEVERISKQHKSVDFIISHTCPSEVARILGFVPTISNECISFLEKEIECEKIYCGHYHQDRLIDKTRIVYNDVLEVYTGEQVL